MVACWSERGSVLEGGQVEAFKFTRHRACLHALQFLWTTKKVFFVWFWGFVLFFFWFGVLFFFSFGLGFCSFFFWVLGLCVAERLFLVSEDELV